MRICSINVNGIRAAERKGMFPWLEEQQFDVICMQETRAGEDILQQDKFQLAGYEQYFNVAEKAGYSGVAVYARHPAKVVGTEIGLDWFDSEGRLLEVDVCGVKVSSLYLPSGSAKEDRQQLKYECMDIWSERFKRLAKQKKPSIVCGDINIAHKKIDIKNWRGNQKNSGFLPEEREWMTSLIDGLGIVDSFRELNDQPDEYTWWSNRGKAWDNNVGWRIDYQLATPNMRDRLKDTWIYREQRFSDHAPLVVEYKD